MAAEKSIFLAFIASIISAVIIISGCTKFNQKTEPAKVSGDIGCSRVVALSKSVSEIWLLAGGTLVGTTSDALELDGLSENTVSIGSLTSPSPEAVVALKPDLVLTSQDLSSHRELAFMLEKLGIKVESIDIECFKDYSDTLFHFTQLTGHHDLYDKNGAEVQRRIEAVLAGFDKSANNGRSYLCMRVSATKNKALKKDNFACNIIDSFGLTNIADDSSILSDLNMEAITVANPDYIFIIFQGKEAESSSVYKDVFGSHPAWKNLKAVKSGKVIVLPKALFHFKPNVRWDEAYKYIYEKME